jgi:hypothetical protein
LLPWVEIIIPHVLLAERALLRGLPRAQAARWDYVKIDECLEGTRSTVLDEITERIYTEDQRRIQWLNGLAGTGKSTLAKTVAHLFADKNQLGASFFCSRDEADRSDVGLIFPTLAFQLSETVLGFAAELSKVIDVQPDIGYALPPEQLEKLIVGPFRNAGSHSQPILIVIDALDECKDEKATSTILMALSQYIDAMPFLKVFVTCRPEQDVRQTFRSLQALSNILDLHLVDRTLVDHDIHRFLNFRLTQIAKSRSVGDLLASWPPVEFIEKLVQKAAGSFIFASTICKVIDEGDLEEELEQVAKLPTDKEGSLGIDDLYRQVVETALKNMSKVDVLKCRSILGTIILLQSPLSIADICQLLLCKRTAVNSYLKRFHSVIAIPREDPTGAVRVIHASFHDFLTDRTRCPDGLFVQPVLQHREITIFLFKHMMKNLHADVADGGETDGVLVYACRYWADHLSYTTRDGSDIDELVAALKRFAQAKLFQWTKTLHVLGSFDVIAAALQKTRRWLSVGCPCVAPWLGLNVHLFSGNCTTAATACSMAPS